MKVDAVIGANFGDERKGGTVDYLAAPSGQDCLVVRFNGGAQAGHTVVTPEGQRHVFSHVGSGAFTGATTFLSRFFVVNPVYLYKELSQLKALGVTPEIVVDYNCLVTTPYDMLINQAIEKARGVNRHGSCGAGLNETIVRNLTDRFTLTVNDTWAIGALWDRLKDIRGIYVPQRLEQLGITLDKKDVELLNNRNLFERFYDDCVKLLSFVSAADSRVLKSYNHVIFEGAQGLLLDEEHEYFPHVTRSKTGLRNVVTLAQEVGITDLTVYYATRCYLTRHGAGPLPGEMGEKPYSKIEDLTNIPNPYQDSLRFAYLDLDLLHRTILKDLGEAKSVKITPRIAISCLDQVDGEVKFIRNEQRLSLPPDKFTEYLLNMLGMDGLVSYGPKRSDTREVCRVKETVDV